MDDGTVKLFEKLLATKDKEIDNLKFRLSRAYAQCDNVSKHRYELAGMLRRASDLLRDCSGTGSQDITELRDEIEHELMLLNSY